MNKNVIQGESIDIAKLTEHMLFCNRVYVTVQTLRIVAAEEQNTIYICSCSCDIGYLHWDVGTYPCG